MKLGAILSTAGSESVIDADGCSAEALRNLALFQRLFSDLVNDLELTPAAEAVWKIFPGEAGLTGLWMLQESHLTVHTFPEFTTAAINLYCCKQRRKWA